MLLVLLPGEYGLRWHSPFFYALSFDIVYTYWPDTREFITQTVELWNRWIRLSCYYNRVSIIYTCNTYFVMHWFM